MTARTHDRIYEANEHVVMC